MLVKDVPKLPYIGHALDDIVQAGSRASEVISRVRKLLKKGERHSIEKVGARLRSLMPWMKKHSVKGVQAAY